MNSYDVFDTIMGRLCYTGHNIFQILENEYSINDFKKNRIFFESLTKNFDKTYQELENHYKKDLSHIKQKEIELEYELSFPIVKYLNKIKKKDILISDMYLSESTIKSMINKHKYIDNNLFVTYGGKSNNTIWKNKNIVSNINTHYGDNLISDFKNPLQHNINAFHIKDTKLNNIETKVSSINNYISYVLRATRLSYISDDILFQPFINFVLPFIIIVCLKIKQISGYNNLNSIVFLSRDGYWFKEIYDILYPKDNTHYVYFSRLLVKNNPYIIKNNIDSISGKKFVFDLQGSGRTFNSLKLKNCFYFMCFLSHDSLLSNYLYKHSNQISIIKEVIETLIVAPHGSAEKYQQDNICLLPLENDIHSFNSYFIGMKLFKKYWNNVSNYTDLSKIESHNLNNVINTFFNDIDYQISINKLIKSNFTHVNNHENKYKIYDLPFYSQIQQDKYYIENIIKYRQNGIFVEIGGYDGITGSNTYFLEKNLNWDGIIVECNPTLVEKCRKNRSCIICDNALYINDNEIIDFIVPMGNEIVGGKEQLGGILKEIKKESLIAFKDSYKKYKKIQVKTININTLLKNKNIYNIDYLSIDVEGAELSILKSWDFDKYKVHFLTIEHGNVQHYKDKIYQFLTNKGFKLHRNNKWDDEYIYCRVGIE